MTLEDNFRNHFEALNRVQLTDLLEPLDLGWRERREKELALIDDLVPLLKKRAGGRTISGLNAYEQ
ncbi:MAG: hypothetical protein KFH87_14055 [Bacteroidetes bacterium]|nr:hypothetical protein [Bacteroidota bacterium]